jgi:hypothetical protein
VSWSWWLLIYVCGYAAGVSYGVGVARRAYADRKSMLWDYHGTEVDMVGAVGAGLLVVFLPLAWPIIGLGMLSWALIMRRAHAPS